MAPPAGTGKQLICDERMMNGRKEGKKGHVSCSELTTTLFWFFFLIVVFCFYIITVRAVVV